jgi:hypothetical protein
MTKGEFAIRATVNDLATPHPSSSDSRNREQAVLNSAAHSTIPTRQVF